MPGREWTLGRGWTAGRGRMLGRGWTAGREWTLDREWMPGPGRSRTGGSGRGQPNRLSRQGQ